MVYFSVTVSWKTTILFSSRKISPREKRAKRALQQSVQARALRAGAAYGRVLTVPNDKRFPEVGRHRQSKGFIPVPSLELVNTKLLLFFPFFVNFVVFKVFIVIIISMFQKKNHSIQFNSILYLV